MFYGGKDRVKFVERGDVWIWVGGNILGVDFDVCDVGGGGFINCGGSDGVVKLR